MDIGKQLSLKVWPDTFLLKVAKPVTEFNKSLLDIVTVMGEAMTTSQGVGLAAPQIGLSERVITFHASDNEGYMVNPEIISKSDETQTIKEGCLSFPGVYIDIERSKQVKVKYQDIEGNKKEGEFKDFIATVIQHEIDHLDGKVFTRFLTKLRRDIVNKKMKKVKKEIERRWEEYERLQENQPKQEEGPKARPNIGTPVTEEPTGRNTGIYDFSEPSK